MVGDLSKVVYGVKKVGNHRFTVLCNTACAISKTSFTRRKCVDLTLPLCVRVYISLDSTHPSVQKTAITLGFRVLTRERERDDGMQTLFAV